MVLRDIHSGKLTRNSIHQGGVDQFKRRVGQKAYDDIRDWLMDLFAQQEWVNTTFVAPTIWEGTPLEPVWDYFSNVQDHEERERQAAIMYGCLVYTILVREPQIYVFHRPEGHHSDDQRPFGLTYRREL
jgi:hypothetical protein